MGEGGESPHCCFAFFFWNAAEKSIYATYKDLWADRFAYIIIGAGFKSILGGELKGMTKALADSRQQVIDRMVEEAEAKGANAIIAMRFDTSEMAGNWTEICAYGTAVRVHKA